MEGRADLVCVRTPSDPSCAEAHSVRCGYVPWPTSFARFAWIIPLSHHFSRRPCGIDQGHRFTEKGVDPIGSLEERAFGV